MVETSFKPSIKIEVVYLVIGILLTVTIVLGQIGLIIILGAISMMVNKFFRTYTINDENEIVDHYQFINKNSKIYRADQITSLTLSQGIIERFFKLGTIQFGLFGKTGIDTNAAKTNGNIGISFGQSLSTIKNSREIFKKTNELIGLMPDKPLYEEKPSTKPAKFFLFVYFVLTIIFGIWSLLAPSITKLIPLVLLGIFLGLVLPFSFFSFLKTKNTTYSITKSYIKYEFAYILGNRTIIIPIKKITNYDVNKNLISYALFKVGGVKVFTGGSNDPTFGSLDNFEAFGERLNDLLKGKTFDSEVSMEGENKVVKREVSTDVLFETKPGVGFIVNFGNLIFLIISLLTIVLIPIFIIVIIYELILWKKTRYYFYEDKMVDVSGVISITKKEIYYKNIKHLKLERKLLFGKVFDQGTIYIFNPGTGLVDNKIDSVKQYNEIYEDLKESILDE